MLVHNLYQFYLIWVTRRPRWCCAGCPPLNVGVLDQQKHEVEVSPQSCAWKVRKDFPPCKRNSKKPLHDGRPLVATQRFFGNFHPNFPGEMIQFDSYFSNGWEKPPRSGGWKTTFPFFPFWEWDFLRAYFFLGCYIILQSLRIFRPAKATHLES